MNNLDKDFKILILKVIFQYWKLVESFQKISYQNIWLVDQLELFKNVPNFCRLCSKFKEVEKSGQSCIYFGLYYQPEIQIMNRL